MHREKNKLGELCANLCDLCGKNLLPMKTIGSMSIALPKTCLSI